MHQDFPLSRAQNNYYAKQTMKETGSSNGFPVSIRGWRDSVLLGAFVNLSPLDNMSESLIRLLHWPFIHLYIMSGAIKLVSGSLLLRPNILVIF